MANGFEEGLGRMGSAGHVATRSERREAADLYAVGKYEPKLTENGIPADVLEKLLPGDDVVVHGSSRSPARARALLRCPRP